MTDNGSWERRGGLLLKVSRYNKNNPEDKAIAQQALRSTLKAVSDGHGASHSEKGIYDNLRLLNESDDDDPDLILEFFRAKWDVCERTAKDTLSSHIADRPKQEEVLLGAATGWFTYGFDQFGNLKRGHHLEDFAVFKGGTRELIRSKLKADGWFKLKWPKESLAGCFDHISLKNMNFQHGIAFRQGEVAPDNTRMLNQLYDNGANMGMGMDSAVLEYHRMPGGLLDFISEDVEVIPIRWKGVKSKRSFIVRWKQGEHDVRFVVTKGQATAAGVPRIDISPWDNGNPPHPYILQAVAAATLRAIEDEVGESKRNWGLQKRRYVPSPNVPWTDTRSDVYKALFSASADRIVIPGAEMTNTFGAPTPPIHVYIMGKKHIIGAFKDAQARFFGGKPMVPGVNIITNEMRLAS